MMNKHYFGVQGFSKPLSLEKTLIDLLQEQKKGTPDSVAVVFEGRSLSYKELHERSCQLAHYLKLHYKIKPNDIVGITLQHNDWLVITVLAVLKAGGAYVSIDPEYPQARIDYMITDCHCKVVIDKQELWNFRLLEDQYSKEEMVSVNKLDDLAYVIYTFDKTSHPKGTFITHLKMVDFLKTGHDAATLFHSWELEYLSRLI